MVLYSVFSLVKGITNLEPKGIYVGSIINNWCYWLKEVPGDLIDTRFEYKWVKYVGMLDSITQYNKLLQTFLMKYMDYVMNMM